VRGDERVGARDLAFEGQREEVVVASMKTVFATMPR
jgi:hypothetical protein